MKYQFQLCPKRQNISDKIPILNNTPPCTCFINPEACLSKAGLTSHLSRKQFETFESNKKVSKMLHPFICMNFFREASKS